MNLLSLIPDSVRRKLTGALLVLGALGWFLAAYFAGCQAHAAEKTSCCSSGICEEQNHHATPTDALWAHVYNPKRLHILQRGATLTGTFVDASRGRNKDGCRHEKDGDAHCWIRLDKGYDFYLNKKNIANEGGNLVIEPICRYPVTQKDAIAACKDWKQDLALPLIGSRVKITGDFVLDAQHGHNELHPISSIEVIP